MSLATCGRGRYHSRRPLRASIITLCWSPGFARGKDRGVTRIRPRAVAPSGGRLMHIATGWKSGIVRYRIRRITGEGDIRVVELLVSYDGSPWMYGVSLMWFRGDRIAREAIYISEGFTPSEARSPWVTTFDPLASVAPEDWDAGASSAIG